MAVLLGPVSGGLVCRDFDTMESYETWAAEHPNLAETLPTVATARGRHVYFRADWSTIKDLGDGELRGAGYCLLPPSQHPDGPLYTWLIALPDAPIRRIDDLVEAGFLSGCNRESREDGGQLRKPRTTDEDGGNEGGGLLPSQGDPSDESIRRVILDTLPAAPGNRHRKVFELARGLRAIPRLADADPDDLEPYVREWHTLGVSRGVVGTEPFEESWIDFLVGWPKIRFPKGEGPMTLILDRARKGGPPAAADRYEQSELRLLVSLCRELQAVSGREPFHLACRTAGRLLGVSHVQAWRWLFLLVHDRVIEEVEKGSQTGRRASRYRYRGG